MYPLEHRMCHHINDAKRYTDYFHKAILKYGQYGFEWSVLYLSDDEKILYEQEIFFIQSMGTKVPTGYNLTDGGKGGMRGYKASDETKEKIRKGNLGKKHTAAAIEKMRKSKLGKIFSDEHKLHLSLANLSKLGKPNAMKGRKHTEESKRKMSLSRTGEKNWWTGVSHSEEHNRKISESEKGKVVSEETKKKISLAHKGKKQSPEHIAKRFSVIKANKLKKLNGGL